MLGPVPTDDLIALYGAAWALVFPTLFEGIGMPVLEALQYGLPVISSNAACLPEVAGDAALFFDPTRVEAIVEALLTAHRQPDLLETKMQAASATLAPLLLVSRRSNVRRLLPGSGRCSAQRRAAVALRSGHRLVKVDVAASADRRPTGTPLTVAINAQIDPERAGGVETALNGLVAHLAAQATDERFLLLSTARFQPSLARLAGESYDVVTWPYPQKAYPAVRRLTPRWQRWRAQAGPLGPGVDAAHWGWWQARRLTARKPDPRKADAFLTAHGASVIHFAYPTRFGTSVPILYEPWDLQHRHYPEFFEPAEWRVRDQLYLEGCERAALVVTANRWTKRDVVEQYGIAPEKIAVIPRGPAGTRLVPSPEEVERVRRLFDLPDRFALFPAMTFPHKNHVRLFEALAILRDRHGIRLPLVCTGRAYEPHWPALQRSVAEHRLDGQVFLLGAVSDETLAAIFASASFMVFPSLFEGLGLPGAGGTGGRPAGGRLERDLPARGGG